MTSNCCTHPAHRRLSLGKASLWSSSESTVYSRKAVRNSISVACVMVVWLEAWMKSFDVNPSETHGLTENDRSVKKVSSSDCSLFGYVVYWEEPVKFCAHLDGSFAMRGRWQPERIGRELIEGLSRNRWVRNKRIVVALIVFCLGFASFVVERDTQHFCYWAVIATSTATSKNG